MNIINHTDWLLIDNDITDIKQVHSWCVHTKQRINSHELNVGFKGTHQLCTDYNLVILLTNYVQIG